MRSRSLQTVLLTLATISTTEVRPASAVDLHNVLQGYTIASWSRRDGLPTTHIRALAQDREGYLWIGTDAGLLRFDGADFVTWEALTSTPLPFTSVRALFTSSDGSLWLGYGESGGITRIRPGHVVQNYGQAEGLGAGRSFLSSFSEDKSGSIWLGRSDGLYKLTNDRWERWTFQLGLATAPVLSTYVDADGAVVLGTAGGAFRLRDGEQIFQRIGDQASPVRSITADSLGRIWVTDPVVAVRLVTESASASRHDERGVAGHIMTDSLGYVWIATIQGLWRMRADGRLHAAPLVEKATAATGLLADAVTCLLADRAGNIWVGTADGLNRLTPHKVDSRTDLGFVIAAEATQHGIWIGTVDELIHFPQSIPEASVKRYRMDGAISAIHADVYGWIWVATSRGVFRVTGPIDAALPQRVLSLTRVSSIASDGEGAVWLHDQDAGLVRWDGRQVVAVVGLAQPIQTLYASSGGQVWASLQSGEVAVFEGHQKPRQYGDRDGLSVGPYGVIYESRDGVIWIGGAEGLSRFANGQFATVRRSERFPLQSFRAIIEDDDGRFWLGTESGIMCVDRAEIEEVFRNPAHSVTYRLYDLTDGLAGFPIAVVGSRRSLRSDDGRLWFVTHRGLTAIDPRSLEAAETPSPVRIERMTVGDRQFRAARPITLPPRTSRIQIDYAVLNLTSPLKTKFRYRLDGFDQEWVDAGARRQALYTNLPPRAYRFVVQADDSRGKWGPPANLEFSVSPAFYQTAWFWSAGVAAIAGGIWVAWGMHVRRVRKQFTLVLGERTRLSREIHDTLLQNLAGMALQCDAIATGYADLSHPVKNELLGFRRQIEGQIREARQSIFDLRSPRLESRSLAEALQEMALSAVQGRAIEFDLVVTGVPRSAPPKVEEQLLRIGQEAVVNVVRHANAHRIRMVLHYEEELVTLRVDDDGSGFDTTKMDTVSTSHFGLTSMRERAELLGGTLHVLSVTGRGTQIEAIMPLAAT